MHGHVISYSPGCYKGLSADLTLAHLLSMDLHVGTQINYLHSTLWTQLPFLLMVSLDVFIEIEEGFTASRTFNCTSFLVHSLYVVVQRLMVSELSATYLADISPWPLHNPRLLVLRFLVGETLHSGVEFLVAEHTRDDSFRKHLCLVFGSLVGQQLNITGVNYATDHALDRVCIQVVRT